jgi:hypothetical protein
MYIEIKLNDKVVKVDRDEYVRLKTLDLKEFGFNVTEEEVDRQVQKILNDSLQNLSVVGLFIQDDFNIY